jgi:lactobin A/cerein 7B family class IIb bacteriocin
MNTLDTVGMSAVSANELEQTDGGILPFVVAAIVVGSAAISYGVTKSVMGSGGGEVLPGFNGFLASTKGIAAAGRPQ